MITLTNLIPNSSFESSAGWSGGAYSTQHAFDGQKSLQMTGTASTPEVTANTTAGITLDPSHIYYARMYGYQETLSAGSVGFYWPIAEPSFQEGIPLGQAGRWNLYSGRNGRSSFSGGSYQFRLDFNNSNAPGTIWFDGVMLVDLTAAFGAGNEPDKAWCDALPFFESTFEVFTGETFSIESAAFNPNPTNINSPTLLSVLVTEQTKYLIPTWFYANEIYCGEG